MKNCHVCNAELEDELELCPVCGADVSDDRTDDEIAQDEIKAEKTEIKNPVFLAAISDVVSAQIFKDVLTDNGIMYSSDDNDDSDGMRVTFGGGFVDEEIYVDADDFETAKSLYDEFLASETEFDGDFSFEDEEEAE